ncbi:MAG TPA: hypothetical protein VFE13_01430, partial [Caulobacteraceae bacterium]|nr:hypothetical protein [Caulobacteraceae bacterium]
MRSTPVGVRRPPCDETSSFDADFESMNRPSFLCIGARNAGATWLSRALREHPEVWLGPLAEYHYFNTLFGQEPASARRRIKLSLAQAIREHLAATAANHVDFAYVRYLSRIGDASAMFTEAWYMDVFSGGAALTKGDITPEYCTIG